ncbi:hypothetical protein BJ742DRAFT_740205 [Cladochytrium replicatum]|nr:hypothetical protein BJ742DRAFT_740205 [Cladochytrium replicatum]
MWKKSGTNLCVGSYPADDRGWCSTVLLVPVWMVWKTKATGDRLSWGWDADSDGLSNFERFHLKQVQYESKFATHRQKGNGKKVHLNPEAVLRGRIWLARKFHVILSRAGRLEELDGWKSSGPEVRNNSRCCWCSRGQWGDAIAVAVQDGTAVANDCAEIAFLVKMDLLLGIWAIEQRVVLVLLGIIGQLKELPFWLVMVSPLGIIQLFDELPFCLVMELRIIGMLEELVLGDSHLKLTCSIATFQTLGVTGPSLWM